MVKFILRTASIPFGVSLVFLFSITLYAGVVITPDYQHFQDFRLIEAKETNKYIFESVVEVEIIKILSEQSFLANIRFKGDYFNWVSNVLKDFGVSKSELVEVTLNLQRD